MTYANLNPASMQFSNHIEIVMSKAGIAYRWTATATAFAIPEHPRVDIYIERESESTGEKKRHTGKKDSVEMID